MGWEIDLIDPHLGWGVCKMMACSLLLALIGSLFMWTGLFAQATLSDVETHAFLESFTTHYEFNPEGRYTHEYHPFLLQWTADSLNGLERRLLSEGLSLSGRIVIMGYEEQAVPQYYTNFKRSKINDEATRKSHTGWSLRLHNRFGFMTGFLFKDLPYITEKYFPTGECTYQHIDADLIPIFNDYAFIFHEHAFGQALPLIRQEQEVLLRKLVHGDSKDVLVELARFWQTLYSCSLKVGNQQIAGTQDVLFSIQYAKHLTESSLPMFKFFIGPDITYPIEVTVKHDKLATQHAQHFIAELMQKMQPMEERNTAYVFCSFVDGVGKSTMLGNIKNWMRFGNNVEKFEHVDNSSSQLCELFQFKDKVFIADLPAQVSHFTYKPDGKVFVDARTQYDKTFIGELEAWVLANKKSLQDDAEHLFFTVKNIIQEQGYNAPALNDLANPFFSFAKNVLLLGKDETSWIPFTRNEQYYLFKESRPLEIRHLTPLGTVKSEGLKNIESEQMLFFEGIRFPLPYEAFLDDLIEQFKKQNIEQVVFVDFLSMYPRSSRENVRINYLLQQMALLRNEFKPAVSLYRDFVSGGELLHTLLCKSSALQIRAAFELETMVRLALFKKLITRTQGDVTGIALPQLSESLGRECAEISQETKDAIARLVHKKVARETDELEKLYGLSKSFVNIQQLSFAKMCAMSGLLQKIFTHSVDHEKINEVWRSVGNLLSAPVVKTEGERLQRMVATSKGDSVKAHYVFHQDCKNELLLAPLLRSLRASWYASILNLFSASSTSSNSFSLPKEQYRVVPLMLIKGETGLIYAVQHHYQAWEKNLASNVRSEYRPFNLMNFRSSSHVMVGNECYRFDWDSRSTSEGIFGFDCKLNKDKSKQYGFDLSSISLIIQDNQNDHGESAVMTTSDLWQALMDDQYWHYECEDRIKTAINNGAFQKPGSVQNQKSSSMWGTSKKVFLGTHEHKIIARFVIRLLATLEMVVKDANADIVVRDGNRDDFKAALKLFEHVVLPIHCGIAFVDDLFDDYDQIEPIPSWDYWESI